jgi:hypothetical protein
MKTSPYLYIAGVLGLATPARFDPRKQRIDVSGKHRFVPPGYMDFRGPCPGLNALANHDYIPHRGIATMDQLVNASVEVFGMSFEQASLAAIYTIPFTVSYDLNHISIGEAISGVVPPTNGIVLKIPPQGLNFAHTSVEVDASPTRLDKYQPNSQGNNFDLKIPLFQQLLDLQKGVPDDKVNSSLAVLADHRTKRLRDGQAINPQFFLQPFGGLFMNGNKYALIPQLFANRSAAHPQGRLDRKTLMSFFGVSFQDGNSGSLKYTRGWERIPENWYRRSLDDPYTLKKANDDLVYQARRHPDLVNKFGIGGNSGRVNDYRNVLAQQLTNGTYTQETLLEGYNLTCLGFVASYALAPYYLRGYYENYEELIMQKHFAGLITMSKELNCTTAERKN